MATYINPSAIKDGTISASKTDETIATKEELTELSLKVGELSQLQTTEKSNLVGAINEVAQSSGGKQKILDQVFNIGRLQPTGYLDTYTDAEGNTHNGVFVCNPNELPSWYHNQGTYSNWSNTIGLGYDFLKISAVNLSKVPYNLDNVGNMLGYKVIDDSHFEVFNDGTCATKITIPTGMDCSLFHFYDTHAYFEYDFQEINHFEMVTDNINIAPDYYIGSYVMTLFGRDYNWRNFSIIIGGVFVSAKTEVYIDRQENVAKIKMLGYAEKRTDASSNTSSSVYEIGYIEIPLRDTKIVLNPYHSTFTRNVIRDGARIQIFKID